MPKSILWFERLWFASIAYLSLLNAYITLSREDRPDSEQLSLILMTIIATAAIKLAMVLLISRLRWQWVAIPLGIVVLGTIWNIALRSTLPGGGIDFSHLTLSGISVVLQGSAIFLLLGPSAQGYFARPQSGDDEMVDGALK